MADDVSVNETAKPYRRREATRLVRGQGCYVDDVRLARPAYAVFLRSPLARGRIKRTNLAEARSLPGVLAVLAAADITDEICPTKGRGAALAKVSLYPLAHGSVRYFGEPVAVAVAETRYQAQDAADAIDVEFEALPALVDPEAALAEGAERVFDDLSSNLVQEMHLATEGVDEAFAGADHVIRERLRTQRIAPCPLEPRACAASFDESSGQLTLWSSTANMYAVRDNVAEALQIGENRLRVIAPDVGGSFGGKVVPYPEDVVVAFLARKLRRPVKWVETRTEHLTNVRHGRDQIHEVEAAVRSDGRIVALRDRIIADYGASARQGNSLSAAALYMTGAYDIQRYQVDAYGVVTNKTPQGPVRGIGKSDASYVIERFVDIIARRLELDPAEVRLRNFVPAEAFPYRTATGALLDSGRYAACLRKALDVAGYDRLREEQTELRKAGVLRGIGLSLVIEPTSAARPIQGGGYGACRIRMEPSGRVSAFPPYSHQGQGHQTTMAHIIARRLGISPDDVEIFAGDTAAGPYGSSATSSRSVVTLMPAAHVAAGLLADKILGIAGHILETDPAELRLENGAVRSSGTPERVLVLREVTRIAYADIYRLPPGQEPGLEVTGYFRAPNIIWEPDERGRRNEFAAYPYDGTVAVVDVEPTGAVRIVKYVSVHDCGTVLVPQIVETQHFGCIAQGTGEALYEELRYDDDGRPLNSTFIDYLIPSVNDVPTVEMDHLVTPTPFTPLGAKGGAETGTLSPPAALGNAIEDALQPLGLKVRERPYTADRLWKLIEDGRSSVRVEKSGEVS